MASLSTHAARISECAAFSRSGFSASNLHSPLAGKPLVPLSPCHVATQRCRPVVTSQLLKSGGGKSRNRLNLLGIGAAPSAASAAFAVTERSAAEGKASTAAENAAAKDTPPSVDVEKVREQLLREGFVVLKDALPRATAWAAPPKLPAQLFPTTISESESDTSDGSDTELISSPASLIAKVLLPSLPAAALRVVEEVTGTNVDQGPATWHTVIRQWSSGLGCLDGESCEDPSFVSDTWQVACTPPADVALGRQRLDDAILTVVVAAQNDTSSPAQLAIFPHSHWLVADWLDAVDQEPSLNLLPQPNQLPLPAPTTVSLPSSDLLLLHPWAVFSLHPNPSSSSSSLCFDSLLLPSPPEPLSPTPSSSSSPASSSSAIAAAPYRMWASAPAPANQDAAADVAARSSPLIPALLSEQELEELDEEEEKANLGNWAVAMVGHTSPSSSSSASSSPAAAAAAAAVSFPHSDARSLTLWRLTAQARELLEQGRFEEALPLLRKAVGLRPRDAWLYYQAGRSGEQAAPKGQLAGRAGRKCMLEDSERFLLRAIELAPAWPLPYASLINALIAMGRGREDEAPEVLQKMLCIPRLSAICAANPATAAAVDHAVQSVVISLASKARNDEARAIQQLAEATVHVVA